MSPPAAQPQQQYSPPPPQQQQMAPPQNMDSFTKGFGDMGSSASQGFGDTGSSSIRLHAKSGGGNSMGSGFGWDQPESVAHSAPPIRSQESRAGVQTSSSMSLVVGAQVSYRQMGKAGTETLAVIVDIEPVGSRKDNYRIRFEDGRERNTGEDKLTLVAGSGGGGGQMSQNMAGMEVGQENMPPAQGYSGGGDMYGSPEKPQFAGGQEQQLRSVEGAAVGELQIGQKMMYRQTARSEPEEVTVTAVELPSSNGFMRTKTFYMVMFSDGRSRETTIDKLKPT